MSHKSGDLPETMDLKPSEGVADLKYNDEAVYYMIDDFGFFAEVFFMGG